MLVIEAQVYHHKHLLYERYLHWGKRVDFFQWCQAIIKEFRIVHPIIDNITLTTKTEFKLCITPTLPYTVLESIKQNIY